MIYQKKTQKNKSCLNVNLNLNLNVNLNVKLNVNWNVKLNVNLNVNLFKIVKNDQSSCKVM